MLHSDGNLNPKTKQHFSTSSYMSFTIRDIILYGTKNTKNPAKSIPKVL